MPFGLTTAPETFQQMINKIFHKQLWKKLVTYLDDINIYSKTFDQHLQNLQEVFNILKENNRRLKEKKCYFFTKKANFLGYKISEEGIRPDPAKIDKIQYYPIPISIREVRQFLGLVSYYRRYIQDFTKIAYPLNQLLHKDQEFSWTDECQNAFEIFKKALINNPIVIYTNYKKLFILYTDTLE